MSNVPQVKSVSNPMEVFTKFCCICFDKEAQLLQLHERSKEELSYLNKLLIAVPEMNFAELNGLLLICNECKLHIEQIYWFRKMCLRNKATLMKYLLRISRKRKIGFRNTIRVINIDKLRKAEVKEKPVAVKVLLVNVNENTGKEKSDIPVISEVKNKPAPVFVALNPIATEEIEILKNESFPTPVDKIKQEPVDEVEAESEPMSFENVYCKKEVDIYEDFENTYVTNIKSEPEEEKKIDESKTEVVKVDSDKLTDSSEHNYSNTDPDTSKTEEIDCDKTAIEDPPKSENLVLQEHSYAYISRDSPNVTDKTQLSKTNDLQTCKLCKKTFTHLRTLNAHWCRAHLPTKPYSCDLCDKSFLNFGHLRVHKEVHKGCRFYYCSTCDKPFITLSFLKQHLEMHAGEAETNMTCDVCRRTFRRLGSFKRHQLTHENERKNTCGDCKKSFPSMEKLREHQRNHIGIRPFTCDVCKKSFTTALNLYTHQDLHGHK